MNNNFDIIIIGASFAGLSFAGNLPKNPKLRVLIVDIKPNLGSTVESTGLITEHTRQLFNTFFEVDKYITNKITTIGVFSTDFENHFFSKQQKPWIYQTDTKKLIQALGTGLPENITIWTEAVYLKNEKIDPDSGLIKVILKQKSKEIEVFTRFLIGADGGSSMVAICNGLGRNNKFLFGVEEVLFGKINIGPAPDKTIYHFWFGEFSIGYGGWLSSTVIDGKPAFRIGLAKKLGDTENARDLLKKFISTLVNKKIIDIDGNVNELYAVYGSKIPISGAVKNFYKDNVLLIGDAAGYCGAFAADGIKGAVVSAIESAKLTSKFLTEKQKDESIFKGLHDLMNTHHRIIGYYKKQLFYRFIWNRMKSNRTFEKMFDIIKKDKEKFLTQFCDSKEKGKGLISIVLKPSNLPDLVDYGIYLFLDIFKNSK